MLIYLILLFTIVPAVELAILIKVGTVIGVTNTLLLIILTGVLGAYLARLQGFLTIQKIQNSLNRGIMPSAQLLDGLLILVGGIVLLTPGFITDAMGFFLLIPWGRALIKQLLKKKFESMIQEGRVVTFGSLDDRKDEETSDEDFDRFRRRRGGFDDIDIG